MDFTTYDCQVTCIARPLVREWLAPLLPAVPGEQQIGIDVAMMPWGATEGDLLEVAPWIIYLSIYPYLSISRSISISLSIYLSIY